MKIYKNDYPWTVIVEDKIGKNSGKPYTDISIGFKEKNIKATCEADKYKTTWFHFLDEAVLLKGATTFENVYQRIKFERDKEKEKSRQEAKPQQQVKSQQAYSDLNDDIPFE